MRFWEYVIGVLLLSSPYLVGALLVALWSPGLGALIALGSILGIAWVVGMGRSGRDN